MSSSYHVVIDTNVLYAALRSRRGESRRLFDDVFDGMLIPHVSVPLVLEYEAVLIREARELSISPKDARVVIAALLKHSETHQVYFRWPAHVRDPDDAHVLNTAVAASCPHLITFNKSDFHQAWALGVTLLTPREFRLRIRTGK